MSDYLQPPKRPEEPTDDWLFTYADLVTLLFAFFVLLFAISSLEKKDLGRISSALKERGFVEAELAHEDPYMEATKELELSLGASGFDQYMTVSRKDGTIEIELAATSFYMPGSAKFTKSAVPMLDAITPVLTQLVELGTTVVEVEGHTDDSPISTAQFPSNWELSSARASNAVRFFIARGLPANKLRAVGYADTQPKAENHDRTGAPIPANQELNRRVVIKVIKPD